MSSLGRRRPRPFRSSRHTSWQIWGLVREVPFLFLNAMTKATQAFLGVCCIFFVSPQQLLVHVAIIRFTLIHMEVYPKTNLCNCPI